MKNLFLLATLLLFSTYTNVFSQEAAVSPTPKPKQMLGWVEKIRLYPGDLLLHAKLAIGSEGSSVDANDIQEFSRNGKKWVRFTITDRNSKTKTLERKMMRMARIKRTGEGSISRYKVKMGICIANKYIEDEVTLADRGDYDYEVLIGQSLLAGTFTVDPALTYTKKAKCKNIPKED